MATVNDLIYEAKREAGALVADLELAYGPGGTAMRALKVFERIKAVEAALLADEKADAPIPPGCERCFAAPGTWYAFVAGKNGGMERCNCARGRWLAEHERARKERRKRRRRTNAVDVKQRAAGER